MGGLPKLLTSAVATFHLSVERQTFFLSCRAMERHRIRLSYEYGKPTTMHSIVKPTTQCALDAPLPNHWMLVNDGDVPGRGFLRVLYEKPSGEEVQFDLEMPRQPNAKVDWIEQGLIKRLRLLGQEHKGKPKKGRFGHVRFLRSQVKSKANAMAAGKTTTTSSGYVNRNEQVVVSPTGLAGTDHCSYMYVLRCRKCDYRYGANGTDIFPTCQGGRPGQEYR